MGGPGASVLLRDALTRHQEDALEVWLRSITRSLEKGDEVYEFWLKEDAFPGTVSHCLFYLSVEETKEHWDEDEKRQIKELLGYLPEQSITVSSGCNQDHDHITLGQFVLHLGREYDGLINMGGAITPPLKPVDRKLWEKWLAESPERVRERGEYMQAQLKALEASLPAGKTMQELFYEQHFDPDSPLKVIQTDVEAKFGPAYPPELDVWARKPSLEETSAYVRAMPGNVYEIEYTTASDHRWVLHIVDVAFLQAWMKHPRFHMIK
ncbi:hypothetical protein KSD_72550 [Ktedonobacter sp. SOSP1-85]|uniref:DUF6368 family protein n=1 Tax=Ktedonobacter sp. SOSP1-85 TaxID=2778367 RepID=UPI001A1EA624|nr:DUF6368 family protein [Ktedonobacter sp. SOSP1-85]GHO79484.1 hypothetical protein KSD_72550 [Ktedonobacter sp. SOSP1-85]